MPSHKPVFDIITIGDTLYDVFLNIHEATVTCQLHKEACLLCLEYAEKIPVSSMKKVPGAGNSSNAAVGASRLGLKSGIVAIIGTDDLAEDALTHWKEEKVSTEYVRRDHRYESDYATILNFKGERTQLIRFQAKTYAFPTIESTAWIYYSALGEKHEKMEKQMLRHLDKHPHIKLAFNPGTTHFHRGLDALKPVIARSDVFIVNKQEAERLLQDGIRPIPNLLMAYHHMGARTVVITDGPNGAHATDGVRIWYQPIFPGKMVERTGAGDSFTTGFVCALHRGNSIPEALRWGTANSWSVVQYIGPHEGLLTKTLMQKTLKRFHSIQSKELHFS